MPANAPLSVEVTRGDMVESRHRVAVAAIDAAGAVVFEAGDTEALVYPRSAIKPLQALVLIESGAADAFGIGTAEIALAAASHSGEPRHVAVVRDWLARLDLSEADLECGVHAVAGEIKLRKHYFLAHWVERAPLRSQIISKMYSEPD